jgi:NADH/NAD ratio-sensing transcriptional regulator Rex
LLKPAKRKRPKSIKIRDERGNITTDTNEIQRILREYFANLHYSKLENLEKMDKFLGTYFLPKLNQEDINNLIRFVMKNEIEAIIKNLPKRKAQDQMESLLNSTRL